MRYALDVFLLCPEGWLLAFGIGGAVFVGLALEVADALRPSWAKLRLSLGRWRHRRSAWPRAISRPTMPLLCMWLVVLMVAVLAQGCATTYRPRVTGTEPFVFTPTPEQCAQLLKERRTYRATEKTATYVSTAGALLSMLALGLFDEKAAPAASAGATLAASSVAVFAGSQVESIDEEIQLGQCR